MRGWNTGSALKTGRLDPAPPTTATFALFHDSQRLWSSGILTMAEALGMSTGMTSRLGHSAQESPAQAWRHWVVRSPSQSTRTATSVGVATGMTAGSIVTIMVSSRTSIPALDQSRHLL